MIKELFKFLVLCCWFLFENRKVNLLYEVEFSGDRWGDIGGFKCRGDIFNNFIYVISVFMCDILSCKFEVVIDFMGKCIFVIIRYFFINM